MKPGVVSAADILAALANEPEDEAWRPEPLPCDLLTPGAVAELLDVSVDWVKDLYRAGVLRGTETAGGHGRYFATSVYALRDERERRAAAAGADAPRRGRPRRRATGTPSPGAGTAHAAPSTTAGRH